MAITRVQYKHQYTATSGTGYAFTSNNTAGNFIVVAVSGVSYAFPVVPSVSDTQGNTYVSLTFTKNSNNVFTQHFYAANIEGGANSISITYDGTIIDCGFTAVEYSGVKTTSPLDVEATPVTISDGSATTTDTSNSFNPQTGSLIFASWADETNSPVSMSGTGITIIQTDTTHADSQGENLSATTGSQTISFTHSSTTSLKVIHVSCFLPEPVTTNTSAFFQFM